MSTQNTKDQDQSKQGGMQAQQQPMGKSVDGSGYESLDSAIIHQKIHVAQLEKLQAMREASVSSLDKDIYRAEANLEQLNRFKALREAARPLMEFLAQSGHPHHTALVDVTGVRIVEDQVSVKF